MEQGNVFVWWQLLCLVSAVNIFAWAYSRKRLNTMASELDPQTLTFRKMQLLLSAGYVLGCAYRSIFPVYDVARIVLFDGLQSSVIVGRTVATIAELCFVAQWAVMMHELSTTSRIRFGQLSAKAIVPMIAVAECFSWYAVLTTANIGHVVEESLWGISALLMVVSMIKIWPTCRNSMKAMLVFWGLMGTVYVGYMFLVDVPMYWQRWVTSEHLNHSYLSISQGLHDAATRWHVSHQWSVWHTEVMWMSLYFSVAVWLSIALIHAPSARVIIRRSAQQSQ